MQIIHGVDITNINRDEFKNDAIVNKLFSDEEKSAFFKLINEEEKIKFIATHWAIKEAIYKALNTNLSLKDINIKKNNFIYVCSYNGIEFKISTSFSYPYIIASVIAII